MKKATLLTSLIVILMFTSTSSFCAEQNNQFTTLQKTIIDAYQTAAPVVYDTSSQIFTTSQEFLRSLFAKKNNTPVHGNKGLACEEYEEITPQINYQNFMKMARGQELKTCLQNDLATALGYLNNVTSDNFKEKNLANATTQDKIFNTFTIANTLSTEKNVDFELAKALACAYHKLQEPVLTNLINEHAQNTEPTLKSKREQAIEQAKNKCQQAIEKANLLCEKETKQAQDLYNNEINKHREFAAKVAFNKHYLQQKSGNTNDDINLDDFTTIEKYLNLLTSQQQNK